jgi:hypothetical protein
MTTNPEVNPSPERCAYRSRYGEVCNKPQKSARHRTYRGEKPAAMHILKHPFTPEPTSQKNDPSTEERACSCGIQHANGKCHPGCDMCEYCQAPLTPSTSEPTCSQCGSTDEDRRNVGGCEQCMVTIGWPSTSEKVVESLIEKFVVDTCCGGRDVWHVDESKHCHAGPMKQIGNERHETGPNTYMNFYECVACHERAWVGLDADRRIVTERSDG